MSNVSKKSPEWLIFFYRVPSRPVSNRMKVWRKLAKAGAVQLKGAVYILPFNDGHLEFLQWLVSEIVGMKGEAAFVSTDKIDTMKDSEIIAIFDHQRESDYRTLQKSFDSIDRKLGSMQKGAKLKNIKVISLQFAKLQKEFTGIRRIDFFSCKEGAALEAKIKSIHADLSSLSVAETRQEKTQALLVRASSDYQGKTWITRKRPFIDRMASAWLIKRFIDRDAVFDFIDEKDMNTIARSFVTFDMTGGEFTHQGDLCTFEVITKSFGLRDKALKKIAEIVHDLDMKDDRFRSIEAPGLEDILEGIRKTENNDQAALEKGMTVFEMLYVSKRS